MMSVVLHRMVRRSTACLKPAIDVYPIISASHCVRTFKQQCHRQPPQLLTRHRLRLRHPTCACVQHSRLYSKDSDDQEANFEIKGKVYRVPNPISVIKRKYYLYRIRQVDPHFNVEEFLEGAKQAVCYFTQLFSKRQFDEMISVTNYEVISEMKSIEFNLEPEHVDDMGFTKDDISVIDTAAFGLTGDQDKHTIEVDVYILACKKKAKIPLLLEMNIKFTRECSPDSISESVPSWTIAHINDINVREFQFTDLG